MVSGAKTFAVSLCSSQRDSLGSHLPLSHPPSPRPLPLTPNRHAFPFPAPADCKGHVTSGFFISVVQLVVCVVFSRSFNLHSLHLSLPLFSPHPRRKFVTFFQPYTDLGFVGRVLSLHRQLDRSVLHEHGHTDKGNFQLFALRDDSSLTRNVYAPTTPAQLDSF